MKLNQFYVDKLIKEAIGEDINYIDVSADYLIPEEQRNDSYFVAKADGVLCGLDIAMRVFKLLDEESSVEYFFNKKKQTPFSDTICLTLTFIPQISKTWTLINNSWKNRDGNNNIILFLKRISILFRLLNKNAYEKGAGNCT